MLRHRDKGFTLIELLIVVAIIGLIAAIAIPNLLNAIDRGKQKRTMADLRAIAAAVEAYAVDLTVYPTAADVGSLRSSIDPIYIRNMPAEDGWSQPFVVAAGSEDYTLGSEGKDGQGGLTACATAPTCGDFDDAIIYSNGQFTQWPEGMQQ